MKSLDGKYWCSGSCGKISAQLRSWKYTHAFIGSIASYYKLLFSICEVMVFDFVYSMMLRVLGDEYLKVFENIIRGSRLLTCRELFIV